MKRSWRRTDKGFTLIELAVVLLVLGVLTRALVTPLGTVLQERRYRATDDQLERVRQALVGHLVTSGVLPCPLPGSLSTVTGAIGVIAGRCDAGVGGVPARVLGVAGPIDHDGALLDSWGRRLLYAVSLHSSRERGDVDQPDWIAPGEAAAVGLSELDADLVLCQAAFSSACPRSAMRADAIAFVVLSNGADATSLDAQAENNDGDTVFALAPRSTVAGHRFADQRIWASRNELAYWLLRAEWLP